MSETQRFQSSSARAALLESLLRAEGHGEAAVQRIPRRAPGIDPPLSYAQQRLWFLDRLVPGNPFYNIDASIPIRAAVSAAVLHRTLNEIVRRHEALRTTFVERDGTPVQVVAPSLSIPLPVVDLRHLPPDEREAEARRLAMEEARTPFDLATGPLIRARLVTLGHEDHRLLLTLHHIVSDGWSLGVFSRELQELYVAYATGREPRLPELAIQYPDFAVWQRDWLRGDVLEAQLAYWRKQLAALPGLPLPTDRPRPAIPTFQGAFHPVQIPQALSERVRALARAEGCTSFMLLLAAFKTLLSRYTDQHDVVVGAPVANRNRAELEPLIGFFVNTLVLRTDLSGNPTFRELLGRVREVTLGAQAHQDLPFERLVEELQPERDLSRNPLFQIIFQLFATPAGHDAPGGAPTPDVQRGNAKFDVRFDLWETAGGFAGQLEYSTDLFDAETARRMAEHYLVLLQAIADAPDTPIAQLPLLPPAERHRLVAEWNDTARPFPDDVGVHTLVEAQARRAPDAVALDFDDARMTYAELDAAAGRVAGRLRAEGVGAETPVGILMERSAAMVVAMLGVLKAGAAYVPLDPAYPPSRLAGMLEDAGAPVVLTHSRLLDSVPPLRLRAIAVDTDPAILGTEPVEPASVPVGGGGLAYVMFTSGSTGRPKGVCVVHRAIARLALNTDYVQITPGDTVAQASNASFDAATFEIWGALVNGARVAGIPRDTVLSAPALAAALREKKVDILFLTTALFNQMAAEVPDGFAGLRCLLFGGEASDVRAVRRVLEQGPPRRLLHVYGPTESTTFATWHPVTEVEEGAEHIPIGRPIAHTVTRVLDRHRQLVPIGVPGELYIGGAGLARGYWNSPDLTAEKFVRDRFADAPDARLYRTGDIVRQRGDGALEFVGRVDHQVKIRGYRVELPEIETVLARHPAVQQAVVSLIDGATGDARIAAYVVADAAQVRQAGDDATEAAVGQWRDTFERVVYGGIEGRVDRDATFNIMGWNSSYTGAPIPADEMREQVERTVQRIAATRPRRVLEIGCGTGLLLFRLAPGTERYVATDFSAGALHFVQQVMDREPQGMQGVELMQRLADDFSGLQPGSFDAVILNSVAQYLPGIHDLLRVIDGAVRVLAPGGTMFLGDLRSYPLLEALHTSVEVFRAPDALSVRELRERIQKGLQHEQELTIDPAFFSWLREMVPQVTAVQVQQKRGAALNELTRFRYDAWLRVGGATGAAPAVRWRDWGREGMTVAGLQALLRAERPAALGFRRVPAARLRDEAAMLRALASAADASTAAELREAVRAGAGEGVDPEALWALADALPYDVLVRWPDGGGADGEMEVLLVDRERHPGAAAEVTFAPARPAGAEITHFANNPLQGRFMRGLVPQLQRHLGEQLPEYMVPSAYVLMDALPLNPNGKVDRGALPRPDLGRPQLERAYTAPEGEVEEQLAAIWSQVLGVETVGAHDHFFTELGGHSLLATQVVSRVREAMRVELPLRSIFETPTVSALAQTVEALRERRRDQPEEALAPITRAQTVDVAQLSDDEVDRLLRRLAAEAGA